MDTDVVRALKHTIEGETCTWNELKRGLELAFGRKNFNHADLHTNVLQQKQYLDESFSSFYVELWVICDEMKATREQLKDKNWDFGYVFRDKTSINAVIECLHARVLALEAQM